MRGGDPVGKSGAPRPPTERGPDDEAPVQAAAQEPAVGEIIQGYELLELLGQGGAGSVFRADHPDHGQVALKILAISKLSRPRVVRRFRDEADIAASVRHPTLVDFVELVEQDSPPRLAYAMELVRGISLREKLQHASVLALTEAIHIAKQMCLGVGALHDAGIVHRDLKPENVMLIAGDRVGQETLVKILDFGVAKHGNAPDDGAQALAEVPGTFVGTPRYMAPEQAAGGDVDGRADLFAIGVMLFEMITGQRPHEGDTLKAVVMAKLKGAPRLTMNPDRELLPQELADTVDACLKLQPDLRPKDARAVMGRLEEASMVLAAVGAIRLDSATKVVRGATGQGPNPARGLIAPAVTGSGRPGTSAVAQPPHPSATSGAAHSGSQPSYAASPASSLPPHPASLAPPAASQPPRATSLAPPAPQPDAPAANPVEVDDDRRRVLVLVLAGLALVVAIVGSSWLLLGDEGGHLLISTPQERASPAAATTTTATSAGGVAAPADSAPLADPAPADAGESAAVGAVPAEAARAGGVSGAEPGVAPSSPSGPPEASPVAPAPAVAPPAPRSSPPTPGSSVAPRAPEASPARAPATAPAAPAASRAARPDAAPAPAPVEPADEGEDEADVEVDVAPAPPSKPRAPPPPPAGEIP